MRHSVSQPLTVIKIGGGLISIAGALGRVCEVVGSVARQHRIVVVPGGGPFADAVRDFDRSVGLAPATAHWMALLAMDQYGLVLRDRIPGAVLVDEAGDITEKLAEGRVVVLAPSRWLRSADVLPRTWDATSDSVAAFVAGALDATRLILIKPGTALREPVDVCFTSVLPYGMPYAVIGCDRLEELSRALSD
jgi:5-(aminomethyl)-3-furanmethanol phosphate kinase